MSDQDQITKERAKNWVTHLCGQGALAICRGIDALESVKEVQDAVSRDDVKQIREKCVRYVEDITQSGKSITQLLDALIEFSPSVLPTGSRRSEEEIRAGIDFFQRQHERNTGRHYTSESMRNLLKWALGESNRWTHIFPPSGSQDKGKEKTDETD